MLTARTGVDAETDRPVCKLAVRSDSLMVLGTVRVQAGAGKAGVSVQAHTFPCGASYVRIVRLRHLLCHNFWKVYGLLAARGSRRYHRTAPRVHRIAVERIDELCIRRGDGAKLRHAAFKRRIIQDAVQLSARGRERTL